MTVRINIKLNVLKVYKYDVYTTVVVYDRVKGLDVSRSGRKQIV